MKTPVRIQLTRPQAEFLDSDAIYSGFVGGRGAGKTWIGAYKFIKRIRSRRFYMIGAPDYPTLRDSTLRTFFDMLDRLGRPYEYAKGDGIITLPNTQAQIITRTMSDPDRRRGPNLSGGWIDEASLTSEEAFQVVLPSLREHGEQGWLDLTFTPKGKQHWTYKTLGGGKPNTKLVHSPTRDNPFLPPNFVQTITEQYGAGLLAQQELGGEFLDMGNTEWPASYFERADFFYRGDSPKPKCRVLFYDGAGSPDAKPGTRDGKRDSDWHAASILNIDNDGHLWFDNRLWRGSQEQAADTLIKICCEPGNFDACGVEKNFGGDIMIPLLSYTAQKFNRADLMGKWLGIPHTMKKEQRIRRLGPFLANGKLHVKDGPGGRETLRQFEQFPLCDHDDALDAMDGSRELAAHLFR